MRLKLLDLSIASNDIVEIYASAFANCLYGECGVEVGERAIDETDAAEIVGSSKVGR